MIGCKRTSLIRYNSWLRENIDHSYEALRVHGYIWGALHRHSNEFLSPLIAMNSDGCRKVCPNQGEGQRNLISARVRVLLSNALGVKKFRYSAYRNKPKDPMRNSIFHICVEGLFFESQKERLDPEVLYIGAQMGASFGPECQKFYKARFVDIVNGQLWNWGNWRNVKEWHEHAGTSMFRSGLIQIKDDQENGQCYNPVFDLNAMDD